MSDINDQAVQDELTDIGFTPLSEFGRKHWQLLLFLETLVVDERGRMKFVRGRAVISDEERDELIPELIMRGLVTCTEDEASGDDVYGLTDLGWRIAHQLRRNRAERIKDADFDVKPFLKGG